VKSARAALDSPQFVDFLRPLVTRRRGFRRDRRGLRAGWGFASYLGVRNFPNPDQARWRCQDGTAHEAVVDIGGIFRDGLVWREVPAADMADFFQGPVAGEPSIFLEIDDRAVSVFMKMLVPTRTEQIPEPVQLRPGRPLPCLGHNILNGALWHPISGC
jgi:hypothetical protein